LKKGGRGRVGGEEEGELTFLSLSSMSLLGSEKGAFLSSFFSLSKGALFGVVTYEGVKEV
jgi:hypothetical protein